MLLLSTEGWWAPCGWDCFTKQDRISLFSSTTHHEREKDGGLSSPGLYIESSPLMCFVNLSFWQSITFQLCCLAWLSSSCLPLLYSPSSLSSLIPNLGDSFHSHATSLLFHFLLAKYKSAFSYYISTKYTHIYYIPVSVCFCFFSSFPWGEIWGSAIVCVCTLTYARMYAQAHTHTQSM